MGEHNKSSLQELANNFELDLIMKSLLIVAVIISAAVFANASGPPPPPPPPPPPAHYPRPPAYGYRPSYGPYGPPKHGGGLGELLPLLLLGGKNGGAGKDLLPLLLLSGGLGGKGGKKGVFGGNSLLPLLLLGKNCKDAPGCVKPNTGTKLCGKASSPSNQNVRKCCVCPSGLFGI